MKTHKLFISYFVCIFILSSAPIMAQDVIEYTLVIGVKDELTIPVDGVKDIRRITIPPQEVTQIKDMLHTLGILEGTGFGHTLKAEEIRPATIFKTTNKAGEEKYIVRVVKQEGDSLKVTTKTVPDRFSKYFRDVFGEDYKVGKIWHWPEGITSTGGSIYKTMGIAGYDAPTLELFTAEQYRDDNMRRRVLGIGTGPFILSNALKVEDGPTRLRYQLEKVIITSLKMAPKNPRLEYIKERYTKLKASDDEEGLLELYREILNVIANNPNLMKKMYDAGFGFSLGYIRILPGDRLSDDKDMSDFEFK